MTASLKHLPLPAAFGERPDGTTWISLGDPARPPHMQFDGPPCAKAAVEIVRAINAAPLAAQALLAVRDACRDPDTDTDTAMPSATGELVEAALAAMGGAVVSPFALKLHELCCAEATAAIADPDASSRMTVDLMDQLANAIAVLTQGDREASRTAAQQVAQGLTQMVFEKAAMVRKSKLKLGGQS